MYLSASSIRLLSSSILLLSPAYGQFLIESLSFGHQDKLSGNGRTIPGWQISGKGHTPPLLSDRVILTPPAPGRLRGALWTEANINYPEWQLDFEFRASGPERGGGNLQVWFTKEHLPDSGLASVYTVGQFDGLVLVLDQYGGTGGMIRGFLNDGSVQLKTHHNLDGLAFGHCDYAYRNLGRPSRFRVKQGHDGLEVIVDDKTCFKSSQIQLPKNYYFGISAASAETPDSFEVNKFIVSTTNSYTREEVRRQPAPDQGNTLPIEQAQELGQKPQQYQPGRTGEVPSVTDAQYYEMLGRLQKTIQSLDSIYSELLSLDQRLVERHNELKGQSVPYEQLNAMDRRIQGIDLTVQRIQRDIEGRDYKESLTGLQAALKDTQENLLNTLPQSMSQIVSGSAPKMGFFLFVVLAFQAFLAGAYVLYKRRRANSPKKFL